MKNILFILLLGSSIIASSQSIDFLKELDCKVLMNQSYGELERNKFDIIIPNNTITHSLVIYIHGGGFFQGDKNALLKKKEDILYFLNHNIAVATINYRFFKTNDSLGVKVCLCDIKTAIQYIKFNATEYNIDKNKVGAYGSSAGAGSCLYFAFHDDMAIPDDKTLLGESTKLKCVGAFETQSTYDVFKWKKVLPYFRTITFLKRRSLYYAASNFYGYPNYKSFKPHKKEVSESLDMLSMIDSNDPSVYLMNMMTENFPSNSNIVQHHKKHAIAVSKELNKHNVTNYLYTHKSLKHSRTIDLSIGEFFVKYLE